MINKSMNISDNDIENVVASMLANGKKVPDYLMEQYKQSKKMKKTIDDGLI